MGHIYPDSTLPPQSTYREIPCEFAHDNLTHIDLIPVRLIQQNALIPVMVLNFGSCFKWKTTPRNRLGPTAGMSGTYPEFLNTLSLELKANSSNAVIKPYIPTCMRFSGGGLHTTPTFRLLNGVLSRLRFVSIYMNMESQGV